MTAIDQQVSVTNQTGSFPFQSLLIRVHSNHSSAWLHVAHLGFWLRVPDLQNRFSLPGTTSRDAYWLETPFLARFSWSPRYARCTRTGC